MKKKAIPQREKIKVGLVQINNDFAGQSYFPLSVGYLQAFAQKHIREIEKFQFMLPIYKRIGVNEAARQLSDADMVFFSTYVWNANISSEIARRIKTANPRSLIVFGGCNVPQREMEPYLNNLPFVDIACPGEGEIVFSSILENVLDRNWGNVPSIGYRKNGKITINPKAERIKDLGEIPSPYLSGVFEPLMKANPKQEWLGLWETNRGCPFGCSYCEWGGDYQKALYAHDLEKVLQEADWFSRNKIEFIFCCDANFGLLKRDLDIVNRIAENKRRYGYPKALSVQNTKNSTDKSFEIQRALAYAGLNKGVNLAFQSLNEPTLDSIGRRNIRTQTFMDLQHRFNAAGIETFTDIILGLPKETYESFTDGVNLLIEGGQHNRIQFNNLSLLPNSEMGNTDYQRRYGFKTVVNKIVNMHGTLREEEVAETQTLVVGSNSMPLEDWVKTRAFGWMSALIYFDKLLQLPFTVINQTYSINYKDMIRGFLESDTPVISDLRNFFMDKARDIQKGGPEFCASKERLNIWWPADELALIELYANGRLERFYSESERTLDSLLRQKGITPKKNLIADAAYLNMSLIKIPFQDSDLTVKVNYNILDFCRAYLAGRPIDLQEEEHSYLIDRTSATWNSVDDWCKKVVWYGNKKGDYLYPLKRA